MVAQAVGMVPRIAGALKALAPVGRFIANRPLQVSSGVGAVRGFADQGLGGVIPGALSGLQTGALLKMVPQLVKELFCLVIIILEKNALLERIIKFSAM